jgi:hypothetical protein
MDMRVFNENRRRFPPEKLQKYAGKYVAWSADGASIIDSDEDMSRLDDRLRVAGHELSEILISMVPTEELILGGGLVD